MAWLPRNCFGQQWARDKVCPVTKILDQCIWSERIRVSITKIKALLEIYTVASTIKAITLTGLQMPRPACHQHLWTRFLVAIFLEHMEMVWVSEMSKTPHIAKCNL